MCYYVSTDDLIANVLILKAEIKDGKNKEENLKEVKTNISELADLFEYSFKSLQGNYLFDISSKDISGTVRLYSDYFILTNSNIIAFTDMEKKKETSNSLKELFYLPEALLNVFKQYFKRNTVATYAG